MAIAMAAIPISDTVLLPSPPTTHRFSFNNETTKSSQPVLAIRNKSLLPSNLRIIKSSASKTNTGNNSSLSTLITDLHHHQHDSLINQDDPQQDQQQYLQPVSDCWRHIHGQDEWAGMLDPIHPLLRSELIRYGDMAQACYDAFDYDPFSRNCGSCRFLRHDFFDSLSMSHFGYKVSRYIYATSNINLPNFFKKSRWPQVWSRNANWIGYIAVSDDASSARLGRRDITIAWRGTVTRLEWIADLMDYLRPISSDHIPCPDPTVKVESGFLDLYTDKEQECKYCRYSAREQILTEIRRLTRLYSNEEVSITFTGHSLGSALATLSAYDVAETGLNVMDDGRVVPVCVFSFSGPRVGNIRFKDRIEGLGVKVLRVVNVHDTVPKVPGIFFNEHVPPVVQRMAEWLPWCYSHVGVELALDHKNSPFLKDTADPTCFHNLEAHLHLLDGYHGRGQRFVLASGRDPALVNKASDFLKDHYLVPPNWRQVENKGMVRNQLGRWMQPERPKHDDHPHPPDIHHHLSQIQLSPPSPSPPSTTTT